MVLQERQRDHTFLADLPPDPHARIVQDARKAIRTFDNDPDRLADLMVKWARRDDPYIRKLYHAILRDKRIGYAILDYARLSAVERSRLRSSLQTHRRFQNDERPPTERQMAYLRELGSAAYPRTRVEASEIIRECRIERRGREAAW